MPLREGEGGKEDLCAHLGRHKLARGGGPRRTEGEAHLKERNRQVKADATEADGRAEARAEAEDRHPITMDERGGPAAPPGLRCGLYPGVWIPVTLFTFG